MIPAMATHQRVGGMSHFIRHVPELLLSSLATFATAILVQRMLNPYKASRRRLQEDMARLRSRFGTSVMAMTPLEIQVAQSVVVDPTSINVSFDSIGGHSRLIQQLREEVLLPLLRPDLLAHSKLLKPTKGVLLHGPPGTGKTMLAKAIAKEAGCAFLNVSPSSMLSKWYGESQKRVAAIWSVAHKLEPSLLFVDEIDCIFRERSKNDHEATASFQSEWLTHWDGLLTNDSARVLVIGTTNRPGVLDPAIGRRLGRKFYVGLPTQDQRLALLSLMLREERLGADLNLCTIADRTESYSGSDLKELCRAAAIIPVREYLQDHPSLLQGRTVHPSTMLATGTPLPDTVRPITLQDFEEALRVVPPTSPATQSPALEGHFHDALM